MFFGCFNSLRQHEVGIIAIPLVIFPQKWFQKSAEVAEKIHPFKPLILITDINESNLIIQQR